MIRALEGRVPRIGTGAFVHDAAEVIGSAVIGARASVWPHAVVRGDTDVISIGAETNVQDGAVVHADAGVPCTVGERVTIGHLACVHGCTVGDEVLVGIGAVVLNGAVIGEGSVIGAGAVVPEGMTVPAGSVVLGVPGRVVRRVTPEQREAAREGAAHYVAMIARHRGR